MSTMNPNAPSWADEVSSTTGEEQQSNLIDVRPENVAVKLSDLQADVDSPLYSAVSFADLNLNESLMKGLLSMGFQKPSAIQSKALPMLLPPAQPANLIAQSQSGTGKTATFLITILSRIDLTKPDKPQALILAPSRELARQIEGVVRSIGQYMEGLAIQAVVPGAVERGAPVRASVLVGTPGSVNDLIKRRQIDVQELRIICLDEGDNMLDAQGLGDQCMRVKQMLPALNQILLFSATFPDKVMNYAKIFCPNAHEIKLERDKLNVVGIRQMYMDCPSDEGKYDILAQLYGLMTIGSSIIFVKKRDTANRIADRLTKDGHRVLAVHSAFEGSERDSIVKDFREGKAKVLITTNVLARGIDVSSVSMVINYDIPTTGRDDSPDYETYLHRIGRTGRFGRVGVSISFVFDHKSHNALKDIANHYGIDLVRLDTDDWDTSEKVVQEIIKSSRAGTNLQA